MTWLFTALTLAGLVIQVAAEIAGDTIPERAYTTASYVRVTAVTAVLAAAVVWVLTIMGRRLARRKWQPPVLGMHREMIERARYAADHDGYFEEHYAEIGRFTEEQNAVTQQRDRDQVDAHFAQLEELLELPAVTGRDERLRRLESFYGDLPRFR